MRRSDPCTVRAGGPTLPSDARDRPPDSESSAWLEELRAEGHTRDEAVARLHDLLLRAARFEVARRRSALPHVDRRELEEIALQSADDALVAVLAKLGTFEGHSRFTTWAFKFALLEAAVAMRRRRWQEHELPIAPERWSLLGDGGLSPGAQAEQRELLRALARAIEHALTPHQREVLLAVAVNGVPIDVLAERLGSTRGALYKTIHDARRKLRDRLAADGYAPSAASRTEEVR